MPFSVYSSTIFSLQTFLKLHQNLSQCGVTRAGLCNIRTNALRLLVPWAKMDGENCFPIFTPTILPLARWIMVATGGGNILFNTELLKPISSSIHFRRMANNGEISFFISQRWMLAARGKGRTGTGELAKAWAEERSSSSIVLRLLQLPFNALNVTFDSV